MQHDSDIYASMIDLKRERDDYKGRCKTALSRTYDLIMTSVNLTKQQKLMIREIEDALIGDGAQCRSKNG